MIDCDHLPSPPMSAPATAAEIRDVNIRYHDVAAADYDAKWGIDFGEVGAGRCSARCARRWAASPAASTRALEIGAGTGYFALNLLRAGVIGEATCTDISPGMLEALRAQRGAPGPARRTRAPATPQALPFPDASFDLVLGHAVLHHLPDLPRGLRGVPPRAGARRRRSSSPASPRATATGWPRPQARRAARWRRPGARRCARGARRGDGGHPDGAPSDDHELERFVDVHAFAPEDLARPRARPRASSACGCAARSCWPTGSAGPTAAGGDRGARRRPDVRGSQYAFRGYLLLQEVDRRLLEGRLPAGDLLQPDARGAQAGSAGAAAAARR